jgi:ribonuclease G
MQKLLVINADGPETRVGLLEGGVLAELYIERRRERGIVGNIYKGKVGRVLPGMQAAFVDIGLDKSAYLGARDVSGRPEDVRSLFVDEGQGRLIEEEEETEEEEEHKRRPAHARIQDLLKENQEVLLQVAKEPIGTKGARSTTYISVPGRHLVFMPTVDHIGVSRRIPDGKERQRLRKIVESHRPAGSGFVVRTVAEGVPPDVLHDDMEYLIRLWNETVRRAEKARAPVCLYQDLDLVLRAIRDLLTADVGRVIIDSRAEYDRLHRFVATFMPHFKTTVELYEGSEPIFDAYGIELEIGRALERKVWLKSGGYLLIDQLEALTAIDVNTGKYVGRRNQEETITRTNLEAVKEIVDQIRLRNIGGILVLDFIDMDRAQNRQKVSKVLADALRGDRSRTNVTKISELGLVEMTRKRVRESLGRSLTDPCPYCEGRGFLRGRTTVAFDALREVRRRAEGLPADVEIHVHPDVAKLLLGEESEALQETERALQKRLHVVAKDDFHLQHYEIRLP